MITLNAPGARTLAETRQWFIDGKGVYVTQSSGQAELHIRGMIVDTRAVESINIGEAHAWAVEWLAAEEADMQADADRQLAATIEHMDAAETDPAVADVRATGARMIAQADETLAQGDAPVTVVLPSGRKVTRHASDPRHPFRAAAQIRRGGERLAAWTRADEDAYGRYVSDGLADTDGWFMPLDRAAWSWNR